MTMPRITPVLLSGGSGTRLWPVSRALYPKQLLPMTAERSMFQETAARLAGAPEFTPPIIVCNDEHRFIIASQIQAVGITPDVDVEPPKETLASLKMQGAEINENPEIHEADLPHHFRNGKDKDKEEAKPDYTTGVTTAPAPGNEKGDKGPGAKGGAPGLGGDGLGTTHHNGTNGQSGK